MWTENLNIMKCKQSQSNQQAAYLQVAKLCCILKAIKFICFAYLPDDFKKTDPKCKI